MAIERIIAGKELNTSKAKAVRNQKVKKRRTIGEILFLVSESLAIAGSAGIVGYVLLKNPVKNVLEELKLRQAYSQAIEQYGDINGDGFVSAQENKELFQNIFYKTGITFDSEGARYSDCREVPTSKLTRIIRDYIEHPLTE